LILLGEGSERETLQALARQCGIAARVDLAGFVGNPFPFLARCAVFVLPSLWEGFALVVLEALACGAAIVATDCPGLPRELLGFGKFGRSVPVDDVGSMVAAIQELMWSSPDRAALVEQARKYSIQNTARQYLELVDGLMARGRGSVRSIERS